MAGFRLKFFMKHNLKYTFKNSSNPTIIIHEGTSSKRQYFCFIHVFNVKEEGLVLAHERQIKYIKQELEKGVNPIDIKQLPSLRTGNTYLDAKSAGKSEEEDNVPDVSTKLKKFRKQIKQKKASKDIEEELDYKTIISNHSDDSQDKKQIPRSPPNLNPADALFGGPQSIANDQAAKKVDKPTTMEFNTVKVSPELELSKLKTKLKNKEDQINKLRKKNQAAESINTMMKNKPEYLEKENKQYKQQLQ